MEINSELRKFINFFIDDFVMFGLLLVVFFNIDI